MGPISGSSSSNIAEIRRSVEVGTTVLRKKQDNQKVVGDLMVQNIEASAPPPTGGVGRYINRVV